MVNNAIWQAVFLLRKFCTEQMFLLVGMQLRNHVDVTQTVKRFKHYKSYAMYTMLNLECCMCARMRFHCANGLVVLRICAP